jgi:hypothetical protein
MKFWKEKFPSWYQLLKRFEEVGHVEEWMDPFRVITPADAHRFFNDAYTTYNGSLPQLSMSVPCDWTRDRKLILISSQ